MGIDKEILTVEQAIETANAWLEANHSKQNLEIYILTVEQRRYGWYMRYVEKGYARSTDPRGVIRGGSPLYVEHSSGLVYEVHNRIGDTPFPDVVAFEREKFGFSWSS